MPIAAVLLERIKNNDPTLITLDLSGRCLGYYDIQQLVNALATNTTLTSLDVGNNLLDNEGAKKALATNTTLTTLNVKGNRIGAEARQARKICKISRAYCKK